MHYEKHADGTVKCIEDEIPFEVPEGWEWTRIGALTEYITSGSRGWAQYYSEEGALFLRMGNLSRDSFKLRMESIQRVQLPDKAEGIRTRVVANDLLFSITAEIGNLGLIPEGFEEAYINQHIGLIRFMSKAQGRYIPYVFLSDFCRSQYLFTVSGLKNSFRLDNIQSILIPIPPAAEQVRIVSKLDALWTLITIIEADKVGLSYIVSRTKEAILSLAIRGQLIPQNPDDEPASVLLERIRIEKEDLINQGRIKRDKRESVIFRGDDNSYYLKQGDRQEQVDDQFIFDLPDGWEWCLLPNVAHSELGKTLDQAKNTGNLHLYLRSVNIKWDSIDLSDLNQMRFEPDEIERYSICNGDLLICEGGDVGRSAIWSGQESILYQNALHRVRFWGGVNPRFFMYYMMYYESKGILKSICKGVTIKHLTGNVLNAIPFALPPLDEQSAIVEKIDSVFAILNGIL